MVQIDESLFRHKSQVPPWSGSSERGLSVWYGRFKPTQGYMQIVDRRDAATLISIIERHVAPGSIIYSDQ